jgi:hypothetical protein
MGVSAGEFRPDHADDPAAAEHRDRGDPVQRRI